MSQDFNQSELIKSKGPWPFITQRIYCRRDHLHVVWRSRDHRKGLRRAKSGKLLTVSAVLLRCMWMPQQLNWWIGIVFAAGSLLFLLGSVLSLTPGLATKWSLDATRINAIFFTGSIPFTTAGQTSAATYRVVRLVSPQHRLVKLRVAIPGNCFVQL